jgi:hypothetical protein
MKYRCWPKLFQFSSAYNFVRSRSPSVRDARCQEWSRRRHPLGLRTTPGNRAHTYKKRAQGPTPLAAYTATSRPHLRSAATACRHRRQGSPSPRVSSGLTMVVRDRPPSRYAARPRDGRTAAHLVYFDLRHRSSFRQLWQTRPTHTSACHPIFPSSTLFLFCISEVLNRIDLPPIRPWLHVCRLPKLVKIAIPMRSFVLRRSTSELKVIEQKKPCPCWDWSEAWKNTSTFTTPCFVLHLILTVSSLMIYSFSTTHVVLLAAASHHLP